MYALSSVILGSVALSSNAVSSLVTPFCYLSANLARRPDPIHRVHPATRPIASLYRNSVRAMEGVQLGGIDDCRYRCRRE